MGYKMNVEIYHRWREVTLHSTLHTLNRFKTAYIHNLLSSLYNEGFRPFLNLYAGYILQTN